MATSHFIKLYQVGKAKDISTEAKLRIEVYIYIYLRLYTTIFHNSE